jgi:putative FmdB family regulatory protein
MPTYTYRCSNCGVEFERVQKFTDKPLTRCPECRGSVRRVPQASAVVFKGSGWYATDHRSPSGQGAKKSEGEAKSESKTEGGEKSKKSTSESSD